jgi:hypothetical protein
VEIQTERCVGEYAAYRTAGHVMVFAWGVHHAADCQVLLRRNDTDAASPPKFSLWHVAQRTPSMHALTPFAVCASFQTTQRISDVGIEDAHGLHMVPVRELPEFIVAHTP